MTHGRKKNRLRLVGLLGIEPGLLQILQDTDSLTDIDPRRYQFDHPAFGVTNRHEHEIDGHEATLGNAYLDITAYYFATSGSFNGITDLGLYLRFIGEPARLIKPLANQVLAAQAADLQ